MSSVANQVGGEVPPRWERYAIPAFLALVIGTFTLIRSGYKDIPLERDEGAYVYMAGVLLDGGVPYVDLLEAKPPGNFYTYAALHWLAGGDLALMHLWMALFVACGTLFFHGLACSWLNKGPALTATLIYSVLAMSQMASGFSLQSEHFVVFFVLAGLFVLDRAIQRDSSWLFFFAGVLLSWSVSIKQNAIFFALFAVFHLVIASNAGNMNSHRRLLIRRVALLASGAIAVAAPILVILYVQGAIDALILWMVTVSNYYVSAVTAEAALHMFMASLWGLLIEQPIPWALGLLGCALLWSGKRPARQRIVLGTFFLCSALTIIPGFRFFGHYYLMLFPALALCAGHFVDVATELLTKRLRTNKPIYFHLTTASSLFVILLIMHRGMYFGVDHTEVLRKVYGTNPFPESRLAADLINSRIEPGDKIFVMGFEPQIHLYTGTRSPTRSVNPYVLLVVHPLALEEREEIRQALATSPPRFVIWSRHYTSWMPPPNADQSFLEEYWNVLVRDYEPIAWYEQYPPLELHVVTGEDALHYAPQGDLVMIVAETKKTIVR